MKENALPVNINETEFSKLVEPYKKEALKTLEEFISIPSVLDPSSSTEEMPFGKEVEKSLLYVARLGERLGFKVDRCDNYVTELTYGEGEKIFDIYAHCDVVPVKKENWIHDPFKLTIEEGNIMYGRGTSDDKGPGLACLFAVKALMDKGYLGGYKMRFIFGGNEENGSLCLKHYFEDMKKDYPTLGISPDADYPLIYAEKSIYSYSASYSIEIPDIEDFDLGDALNIVLAKASVSLSNTEKVKAHLNDYLNQHPEVKATLEENVLTFKGKPCHGSIPWNGINAGLHLLNFLGESYGIDELTTIYNQYHDGMGNNFNGNFKSDDFDCSSYNVGRISYSDKKLTIFVNVRFPSNFEGDVVLDNVRKNTHAVVESLGGSDGFISDPKSDFVNILLNAYKSETGDYEAKPLAIGGGTYARESRNSVAFGSQFPNRDYRMHGDDEFFPLSDFYDSMQIYAHAIYDISVYLRDGKIKN